MKDFAPCAHKQHYLYSVKYSSKQSFESALLFLNNRELFRENFISLKWAVDKMKYKYERTFIFARVMARMRLNILPRDPSLNKTRNKENLKSMFKPAGST